MLNKSEKRFWIEQLGCPSNRADGNRIANFLVDNGWKMSSMKDADLIIVMTCGFSLLAQDESSQAIRNVASQKKESAELWIGGCLPSINPKVYDHKNIAETFNPRNLSKLNRLAENESDIMKTLSGESYSMITKYPEAVYLLRISTGCTEKCSYCSIRRATGKLKSRPAVHILSELRTALEMAKKTIILLGEDIGCYGHDIGESIFTLLRLLGEQTNKAIFHMSSIHPKYFISDLDRYIELFSLPFVGKKISLPLQSGSDKVLKSMKRDYSIEEIKRALHSFCSSLPDVELATDLMVGFPGETLEDFEATRSLLREFPFDYVDCFQYDEITGVPSSKLMKKIHEDEKKRRLKVLSFDVVREYMIRNNITTENRIREFLSSANKRIYLNSNVEFKINERRNYGNKAATTDMPSGTDGHFRE